MYLVKDSCRQKWGNLFFNGFNYLQLSLPDIKEGLYEIHSGSYMPVAKSQSRLTDFQFFL